LLFAQSNFSSRWYLGSNPLSYAIAFPLKEEIKRFGPIFAGNEYGFNLVGGYYLLPHLSVESRASIGNIHQVAFVGQLHAGINYYFTNYERNRLNRGIYAGAYLKYWDYTNRLTKIHFYNISPYLNLGYQWNQNRLSYDLRLSQTFAIHSWTSMDATLPGTAWFFSPWPKFIPILPLVSFTIGYHFNKE
jgi:hypothetical protein